MDTKERGQGPHPLNSPDPIWHPAPLSAAKIELEKAEKVSRGGPQNF
jgi:hypothetical protein